jgi:hypothetical protein
MNYQEFVNEVKEKVQEKVRESEIIVSVNEKNNQVQRVGITFKSKADKKIDIAPTIYLESYFFRYERKEISIEDAVEEIKDTYIESQKRLTCNNSICCGNEMIKIDDFKSVKPRIICTLVNRRLNKESLLEMPYIPFRDLAITFRIVFSNEPGNIATAQICNEHMELWGVSIEDITKVALQNTQRLFPVMLKSMDEVLKDVLGKDDMTKDVMYLLSNQLVYNGSITILYPRCLKKIADMLGENFYILPSSIHEVILLRESFAEDAEYLRWMIQEVNATEVAPEEILSDRAYYYDRETDTIIEC